MNNGSANRLPTGFFSENFTGFSGSQAGFPELADAFGHPFDLMVFNPCHPQAQPCKLSLHADLRSVHVGVCHSAYPLCRLCSFLQATTAIFFKGQVYAGISVSDGCGHCLVGGILNSFADHSGDQSPWYGRILSPQ